jgi:NAD-dependent dihydropyrimidine dehydrogenase PreA subunit
MTFVVTNACVDVCEQKCVNQCPVDCIYLAERSAYIHPDECIDCGACVPVCPVSAILSQEDLDAAQMKFLTRQIEVFRHVGSPGGASAFGRLPADHPDVAALPLPAK